MNGKIRLLLVDDISGSGSIPKTRIELTYMPGSSVPRLMISI